MRRRDNFVESEQRMILWRRLLFENIQRGAGDNAGLDRTKKRAFINQSAAGAVDDPYAVLHFRESFRADNAARLGGQRRVYGQEISARKDVIKRRHFDLEIARLLRSDERIVADDLHAEGTRARRDGPSDAAETDNAQSFSLQLDADKFF